MAYIRLSDRLIKLMSAIVLIILLIFFIWGVGISLGGTSEPAVIKLVRVNYLNCA